MSEIVELTNECQWLRDREAVMASELRQLRIVLEGKQHRINQLIIERDAPALAASIVEIGKFSTSELP